MSRNGSGTYSLPVNSWNPANNGTPATAADWQTLINDVAAAITQSLSRDGQTTLTGNLQMGSNKLTGLSVGTAAGDSLAWQQLFSQGQPADLASAATTDIGLQNTTVLNITGTTTITSFGINYNGPRFLRFAGALTLTHNATTLILPGAANITTAANDCAIVVPSGTPANGWRVVSYVTGAGTAFANSVNTSAIQDDAVTFAKIQNIATDTILGRVTAGTGDVEALTPTQAAELYTAKIQPITATVAANAMTITLNPTTLDFRSSTRSSGAVVTRSVASAISLVIPSGATMGTIAATAARFIVLAIDNAGTVELAVVNLAGGNVLDEADVISTTVLNTASDSNNVIYSTAARTNVPYRIVGFVDNTQATPGTYATAPSLVQGAGGQALASLSSIGYGQTWQSVTRISGTTYYNTTGKPIMLGVRRTNTSGAILTTINGVTVLNNVLATAAVQEITESAIIPHGNSYVITATAGATFSAVELR